MCSACGFPSLPGHWTDAGARNPGSRLRLRFTRLAMVNRLLAPYRLSAYDDGSTPGLQLMAPNGERVLVPDLEVIEFHLRRASTINISPGRNIMESAPNGDWPDSNQIQSIDGRFALANDALMMPRCRRVS